ncbi:MAG: DNA polymerase I [Clostridia bacterium]|nr:DNA polymerase I [Clostridia bacterium]
MDKFVIIDGNSLINRAYYGLPPLKSLSGKPCGAVYGFINMMLSVISSEKPKYLVCVFDAGKHTFRHDIFKDYKGTRGPMPEDLHSQLLDLKELLTAMGIKILEQKEIEADDIVGTLTRKFNEEFMLISGDKDLLQLVNNNTTVWLTKRGITDVLKVTPEVLKAEFNLEPYQVIELKAIMGDSSDNIPGVAGIGKVGAGKLIDEYKDLDNIYANIDKLAKGPQAKLIENKEMAYLSKQLATIKLDVELDCTLKDCEYTLPFNKETFLIMQDLDFKSMLKRKEFFAESYEKDEEVVSSSDIQAQIIEIEDNVTLDEMISNLGDSFAFDVDDLSCRFAKENKEYVLYTSGAIFSFNQDKIKALLESEKEKICFDCKDIMWHLSHYGIGLNKYFDVSLAIYIANEMDAEISLADALKLNQINSNGVAITLLKLKEIYVNKLIKSLQLKLYADVELPLVEVLFDMEKVGIQIDAEQIKNLSEVYHKELDELTAKIYEIAGVEFNINSPKQLQGILFDILKIEYKGKPSTSIEVLNAIKDKHEIVEYIIRYRKIAKLISTYLDGMLNYVGDDNKIHTTFMQRTTSTGRLSSREPNLQNLPIRDDEGRILRKMFLSSFENGTMVSADYNQIELRLIANFSGDETMINDYLSGKDIHTATASKIFGVAHGDVTKNMRRVAKSVNFGIIYGIGAYGLSQNINSTVKEANEFIKKYLEIYPKVKEYGEECIRLAREKGYAETLMGRIRHLNDINSGNHVVRSFAERVAKNMPLQGSASDIIKVAMIKVWNRMKTSKLISKLVLQIHDELVVDCYPGEEEIVKQILKEEMESVVELKVPLVVEIESGKTLYDAK